MYEYFNGKVDSFDITFSPADMNLLNQKWLLENSKSSFFYKS